MCRLIVLNGDLMMEMHRSRAFHQGNTFSFSTWPRMVYEEGAFKNRQSDSCWNDLDFSNNDKLNVKYMSLLDVVLADTRTGNLLLPGNLRVTRRR